MLRPKSVTTFSKSSRGVVLSSEPPSGTQAVLSALGEVPDGHVTQRCHARRQENRVVGEAVGAHMKIGQK